MDFIKWYTFQFIFWCRIILQPASSTGRNRWLTGRDYLPITSKSDWIRRHPKKPNFHLSYQTERHAWGIMTAIFLNDLRADFLFWAPRYVVKQHVIIPAHASYPRVLMHESMRLLHQRASLWLPIYSPSPTGLPAPDNKTV